MIALNRVDRIGKNAGLGGVRRCRCGWRDGWPQEVPRDASLRGDGGWSQGDIKGGCLASLRRSRGRTHGVVQVPKDRRRRQAASLRNVRSALRGEDKQSWTRKEEEKGTTGEP